jgi:hypothetical protein
MKRKAIALTGAILLMAFSACQNTRTVDFDATFTGIYNLVSPDSTLCGPGPWFHIVVDCEGEGTELGDLTAHFDFCADTNGYYPGARVISYMIAENGDSLFVECAGQVLTGKLDDHPDFVVEYWRDPFQILGGTGKFEGATGEGMTDDYNSSQDDNSHHHWTGTMTLIK